MRIAIAGAGAISGFGLGWRGLAAALEGGAVGSREAPAVAAGDDAGDAKARKLMSRGARLAGIALKAALADAGFSGRREEVGAFMGVGASGGATDQLEAMLAASQGDRGFSLERFGGDGLAACNPLFAFQLMNNFTLCHGAILAGVGGPNGAFFSRGAGTVAALAEAVWAIREGDCDQALAGGADTALHPVTLAELREEGHAALHPAGEGAAMLALAKECERPRAFVESVEVFSRRSGKPWSSPPRADRCVLAACGLEAEATLHGLAPGPALSAAPLGHSLAAGPALGWAAALDLLSSGSAERVTVLSLGVDGDLGVVLLAGVAR